MTQQEDEKPIDQVEAIFQQVKDDQCSYTVNLSIDTFAALAVYAYAIVLENTGEDDREVAESLSEKLIGIFDTLNEKPENQRTGLIPITVELSARELDTFNEQVLRHTAQLRRIGGRTRLNIASEGFVHEMRCLIDLNRAFEEAGGTARPAFARFREGI